MTDRNIDQSIKRRDEGSAVICHEDLCGTYFSVIFVVKNVTLSSFYQKIRNYPCLETCLKLKFAYDFYLNNFNFFLFTTE
jgi:hypothetical protein